MKKFIYLLFLLPLFGYGQVSDGSITTLISTYQSQSSTYTNEKAKIVDIMNKLNLSKINLNQGNALVVGGPNTYAADVVPAITSYVFGQSVKIMVGTQNSGASTINLNSLGAKTIKKQSAGALVDVTSGDLIANGIYELTYDGTYFQWSGGGSGGGGSGTVNSGTANQLAYYAGSGTTVSGLTAITASRALASDANGLPVATATTAAELAFVNGVTSAIQTQLNAKAPSASPALTGVPTAPTAAPGTNTTQIATMAAVQAAVTAGSVADGDKGDITVSSTGTVWTIDNLAVTNAKINDLALSKITGAGTGVLTALAINTSTAGSVILNGGNAGTPSALVGTNISGTAPSLTAGNVTTNANLTGAITSVGNATSLGSFTSANLATALTDEVGSSGGFTRVDYVDAADALRAPLYPVINNQTSNYSLVLTDVGKTIEMNIVSTANSVTIPLNATVAFPLYTQIPIVQYGTGLTSVVATGGVTIRSSSGNLNSPGQYSPMVLEKRGTDEWYLWNGTAGTAGSALTKTDDTNVTATLGGSSSTALVNAASITLGWTGTLAGTRGGTGTGTTAVGDILYGTASNTWSKLAVSASAGSVLGSSGTIPAYLTVSNGLTADATSLKLGGALTANTNISGAFSLGMGLSPSAKFHIQSLGNTSGTNAFIVQNSSAVQLLALRDDGKLGFGSGGVAAITPSVNGTGSAAGGGLTLTSNYAGSNLIGFGTSSTFSNTAAGIGIANRFNHTFNPTSGSATDDAVQIFTTINQTGGANGISTDLHIIPTRTAVGGAHTNIVVEDSPSLGYSIFGGAATAAHSTLQSAGSFALGLVSKSANYTFTAGESFVVCTANSFTITLPTAVGIEGRMYTIWNIGSGIITLATTSSQTIDLAAPGSLAAGNVIPTKINLVSFNGNWLSR